MEKEVLLMGNPILREVSKVVSDFSNERLKQDITDLKDTLDAFRKKHSFGRGIAANQIGVTKRLIALNLGRETFVIINPKITLNNKDTFTLWDDCMSFPDLFVMVKRYKSINVEYQDEFGNKKYWGNLSQAESELLQHEIDHLDGILAVDKQLGKEAIIYKTEFEKDKAHFESKVDYVIKPT